MTATPITRSEPAVDVTTEKKIVLIYAGDSISSDKKRSQMWLEMDGLENDGREFPRLYDDDGANRVRLYSSLMKFVLVGEIVEFVETNPEKGSIKSSSGVRRGKWENEADRIAWKARDASTNMELEARKKSKQDELLESLAPAREAYKRLGGLQRNMLLAKIVLYITRGT